MSGRVGPNVAFPRRGSSVFVPGAFNPRNGFFFNNPFFIRNNFDNPFIIGGRHHRGFGPFFNSGFSPFFNNWGWGWGGWPYAVDYSSWGYDQAQDQYEAQTAQNERLQEEMAADQRQQMELEQELADQRAADAAALRRAAPAQPASTPTERAVPPTVLVYRDHHQVEVSDYAITSDTIYEINPHYTRKIKLSELDIPATIAANDDRGVQFTVPGVQR